ncbi:MAG: cell division protein FtsA [Sphingobacteriaceae bacterium]|nr:cell division protein FtsA [Cytophagaceae bacterium]
MDERVVVGLDIGSTKVCAVVGRVSNHGTLEILGVGMADSTGVPKGVVLNINKTVDAVNQAIEQAANQSDYDIGSVWVSLGGQNVQGLRKKGSLMRDTFGTEVMMEDVERLSKDVLREPVTPGTTVLHVLPQEYSVDNWNDIPDPVGMTGMRLQASFQVITSPTLAYENVQKCVERARSVGQPGHLEPEGQVFAPLAAAMATLTEEEKEDGVALVDIGGGTTDVIIFHKKIIRHLAVIPLAGNSLTTDLERGCSVSSSQAEVLKRRFGAALHTAFGINEVVSVPGRGLGKPPKDVSLKNVGIIIEERLKEIAALVNAELIRSGYENKLSGGIVLTGGTAKLEDIDTLFATVMGKEARVGKPNQHFVKGKLDVAEDPACATAVGLVWCGSRSLDYRQNEYRRQEFVAAEPIATVPPRPTGPRQTEVPIPPKPKRPNLFRQFISGVLNDEIGDKDSYSER